METILNKLSEFAESNSGWAAAAVYVFVLKNRTQVEKLLIGKAVKIFLDDEDMLSDEEENVLVENEEEQSKLQ